MRVPLKLDNRKLGGILRCSCAHRTATAVAIGRHFDFITKIPNDWTEITEVRSYEESIREVPFDDKSRSPRRVPAGQALQHFQRRCET